MAKSEKRKLKEDRIIFDIIVERTEELLKYCALNMSALERRKKMETATPCGRQTWTKQDEAALEYIKFYRQFHLKEVQLYQKMAKTYRSELEFLRRFVNKN